MTAELHHWPLTIAHSVDRGPGWTGIWQRPGTDDAAIVEEIVHGDSYHLRGLDLSPELDELDGLGNVVRPNFMRDKVVIDIGANIGAFTLTCARMGAKVVAVEPDADNFAMLQRNTAGVRGIECLRLAVGAERGHVGVEGAAGTAHTVVNAGAVQMVTLADLLEAHKKVDLIKIDTEGSERAIIEACPHELLARVDRFVMELHGPPACSWADPNDWGHIVQHLLETHACDLFGRPSEGGGHLYARSYTAS